MSYTIKETIKPNKTTDKNRLSIGCQVGLYINLRSNYLK